MNLEKLISSFIDTYYNPKLPVLLALSGGPDSLALFYLLKNYSGRKNLQLAVAHVDHGWREESGQEALILKKLVNEFQIVFHQKTLDPQKLEGNLEEACRNERLKFFKELCVQNHYQAVILGHHGDDQSETVLKRILEGSNLSNIGGMTITSLNEEINLWRPFLEINKIDIINWLNKFDYKPFIDKTNLDSRFLRGRLRTTIIPELSQQFGKEVGSALKRIGKESLELKTYLDFQIEKYLSDVVRGPFGSLLDFSKNVPIFDIELKHLIRKICEKENVSIPYKQLLSLCNWIRTKKANAYLNNNKIYVDRGRLFVLRTQIVEFSYEILLNNPIQQIGNWVVTVERNAHFIKEKSNWINAWKGNFTVVLPENNYFLSKGPSTLSDWWTNEKIPALLRWIFPVVLSPSGVEHEFLTGRTYKRFSQTENKYMVIKVCYKIM